MFFLLFTHKLSDELESHNEEHKQKATDLEDVGRMVIVEDRKADSEDLSGGDNEGNEMLFELFDHTVDKHLTQERQNTELYHVDQECCMGKDIDCHVVDLKTYNTRVDS